MSPVAMNCHQLSFVSPGSLVGVAISASLLPPAVNSVTDAVDDRHSDVIVLRSGSSPRLLALDCGSTKLVRSTLQ